MHINDRNTQMPESTAQVTCFHDGECPICNLEINKMKQLDSEKRIRWVDISRDQAALDAAGINYQQAMKRIHVINEQQTLKTGVRGFLEVWKKLPYYRRLAVVVEKVPLLLPVMEGFYRVFAYYRLPLTGKKRV
jgi:predicted DCC family thiol-disulfide oxidoreductase YuxK